MPISIPLRHIDRMFPYEFYAELFESFNEYVPSMNTFSLKSIKGSVPNEKEIYYKERESLKDMFKKLSNHNVIHITPNLQVLINMPVTAKILLQNPPLEQAYMFVQYYGTIKQPLLTQEQDLNIVRQIPEILWDDPNLLIGIYDPNQQPEGQVSIIKAPEFILKDLADKDKSYDN